MKIIHEKDSPLLERKTLVLELEYPRAPPFPNEEVKRRIASQFKVDEKLIAVKKIQSRFGGKYLRIICNIYKNEDMLKRIEVFKKKEKQDIKENGKEAKKAS